MGRKLKSMAAKYDPEWLTSLDGRTALAQEMRDRYEAFSTDLGGFDNLTYQKHSLVQRALWLEYWLTKREEKLASGEEFEIGAWIQGLNSLQGIYGKLGLERRSKPLPIETLFDD